MKKGSVLLLLVFGVSHVNAQDIVGIIAEGVTKVIRAVDLKIQRIQTQTIVLQEAQKELENTMTALRLGEIHDWVEQQKDLYAGYFQELWQVKDVLSGYHKVSEMVQEQERLLAAYRRGIGLFRQDSHFSAGELGQIDLVFSSILTESMKNLQVLSQVIQPFTLQMTDQERMEMIDQAAAAMDRNYRDMQVFINQNELISLQRARDENDFITLKKLYGL